MRSRGVQAVLVDRSKIPEIKCVLSGTHSFRYANYFASNIRAGLRPTSASFGERVEET
ncbi:hypothetical protein P692DRAFT_201790462 [Suillus brevipes Sb2]|nr:hypothetical protein P692DRAFT_201790462 [Suillus brevipes Sb2]